MIDATQESGSGDAGRRSALIAVGAMTALALGLRVAMAARSGIWRDEAQFLWIVRMPTIPAMLEFLRYHESHPPLFYLMMRAWLRLFGDTETSALALSVLLGVALVPSTYWVGRRVFSNRTGLIAAALVAASPLLAEHSGLVRPYSLLPLLCLASTYELWRALSGGGARSWAGHVAATLAMLLTHNWSWMVLGAQWIVAGAWLMTAVGRDGGRSALRGWVIGQAAILLGFSPWLPTLLYQTRHAGYGPQPFSMPAALIDFARTMTSLPAWIAAGFGAVLIGLAVRPAKEDGEGNRRSPSRRRLALLLLLGVPILAFAAAATLSLKTCMVFPKCMLMTATCMMIVIAHGVDRLPSTSVAMTVALSSIYLAYSVPILRQVKSDARERAAEVAAASRPGDLIIISPPWLTSSFLYYYHGPNRIHTFPFGTARREIDYDGLRGRLLDPRAMADLGESIEAARREGRRVWLVTDRESLRLSGGPNKIEARDLNQMRSYIEIGHAQSIRIRNLLESRFANSGTEPPISEGPLFSEFLELFLYEGGARAPRKLAGDVPDIVSQPRTDGSSPGNAGL